jgi:large subunit ribosomal protein L5
MYPPIFFLIDYILPFVFRNMLKEDFKTKIVPRLVKELNLTSVMAVPALEKVVLNVGTGKFKGDKKKLEQIKEDLAGIAGQAPVATRARKSIAEFGIRQGQPIGFKVTLRGQKMWDFVERLIKVALPRTRDFAGIKPESVDGKGNLTIGFEDQLAFPEIKEDETETVFGFEATVVTTAKDREQGLILLKSLGFPIKSSE